LTELRNDDASNALFWRLNEQTLDLTDVTFGNLVHGTTTYVRDTGTIERIRASSPGQTFDVQDLYYEFDTLGNLTRREDVRQNVREEMTSYAGTPAYDALNRLRNVQRFAGAALAEVETYTYDDLGNLTVRTEQEPPDSPDVLPYDYANNWAGCAQPAGPHAVKNLGGLIQFCYDENGNQLALTSPLPTLPTRTQTWTSYNKPRTVTMSGQSLTFSYGANRGRFKQVNTFSGQTTLYVDGLYEKQTVGATEAHVHYIYAGGEAVAIYKSFSGATQETLYLHRDQLGSVSEITAATGAVVERLSYDPLGKRRDADWSDSSSLLVYGNETSRGFTGHESLDDVALVHMGGRVYDPLVGRMLSADPYVQFPSHSQSFNRYSYVLNNPLTHTDPSGFCIAAGPSCGGFMAGLGGAAVAAPRQASIGGAFSYAIQAVVMRIVPQFGGGWSFGGGGLGGLGGMNCIVASGSCLPSTVINFDGGSGFGFGFGAPMVSFAIYTYTINYSYSHSGSPAFGPVNTHVGQGWMSKLWSRVSGALLPNITALGDRGVPGSFSDNAIGYFKAAYNTGLDFATSQAPIGLKTALGMVPRAEIADNQLLGAAIYEGGSWIAGAVGGRSIAGVGSRFAARGLPNSALVVRGGNAANQTAAKINAAIGPSRTPGVSGFSAQCNGGTCLSELGQFLRNKQLGVTTVGEIRAIGGDVIATPGFGHHVTVTGVSGEAVSPLFRIVTNPNPLVGP
jgi:RHS repeat-associated protein